MHRISRRAILSALMAATAMVAAMPMDALAQPATIGALTVTGPIPVTAQSGESYRGSNEQPVAGPGLPLPDLERVGYLQEEYFISGTVDGKPYRTSMLVRRPKDLGRFSGLVGVETIHAAGAIPFWGTGREVWAPGNHVWVAVASQRSALETQVKKFNAGRYAALDIPQVGPLPAAPGAPAAPAVPGQMTQDLFSQAIMTQVGAWLKSNPGNGPLAGRPVRYLLMGGASQTGGTTINYIQQSHAAARLPNGRAIYDGYMPALAFARTPLSAADGAAILHIVSEGEVVNAVNGKRPMGERPDSDAARDRYRLYEVAGGSHVPTRGSTVSASPPGYPSQFPSPPISKKALLNLIDWVTKGVAPPKASRIEIRDGQIVRDQYGNAVGGMRSPYVDVPVARFIVTRPPLDGQPALTQARNQQGIQEPLPPEALRRLYPTRQAYLTRFDQGIDRMVAGRWINRDDGEKLKAEEAKTAPM